MQAAAQNSTAYGEDDMVLDVKLWAERCASAWAGARGQLRAGKTRSGAECVGCRGGGQKSLLAVDNHLCRAVSQKVRIHWIGLLKYFGWVVLINQLTS